MSAPVRILGAAALLVAMLVGLVVAEDRARAAGREVVLSIEAIDPRNLLTGHYVALQFAHQLDPGQACPPGLEPQATSILRGPPKRATGWVALSPAPGGRDVATGLGATRAEALRHGRAAVRGEAYCATRAGPDGEPNAFIWLDVGVRRFHADQAQAVAIEAALRGRDREPAAAVISVGRDGRARLKGVVVGGARTDLTWW